MFTVTESAKQVLKDTLVAHTDDPENVLRLSVTPPGQLGIVVDKETEGDQVIEHEGAKVLLLSSEVVTAVEGLTLDAQDTAEGPKLIVVQEKTEQ